MARNDEYCCCPWTAASFPGVSALARIRSTYINRSRPRKITTRMERSFATGWKVGLFCSIGLGTRWTRKVAVWLAIHLPGHKLTPELGRVTQP